MAGSESAQTCRSVYPGFGSMYLLFHTAWWDQSGALWLISTKSLFMPYSLNMSSSSCWLAARWIQHLRTAPPMSSGHPTGRWEYWRSPRPFCSMIVPRIRTSIFTFRLICACLHFHVSGAKGLGQPAAQAMGALVGLSSAAHSQTPHFGEWIECLGEERSRFVSSTRLIPALLSQKTKWNPKEVHRTRSFPVPRFRVCIYCMGSYRTSTTKWYVTGLILELEGSIKPQAWMSLTRALCAFKIARIWRAMGGLWQHAVRSRGRGKLTIVPSSSSAARKEDECLCTCGWAASNWAFRPVRTMAQALTKKQIKQETPQNHRGQFTGCGKQHSSMQKPGSPQPGCPRSQRATFTAFFWPWHIDAKTDKVGSHGKRWKESRQWSWRVKLGLGWKWQRDIGAQGTLRVRSAVLLKSSYTNGLSMCTATSASRHCAVWSEFQCTITLAKDDCNNTQKTWTGLCSREITPAPCASKQ